MSHRLHLAADEAHDLVDIISQENDIVRIVDPASREVLYWPSADVYGRSDSPCLECNSVWGRHDRCANCSSVEALRLMKHTYKMEFNNSHAFWVKSRPMVMDGTPCVLETVNDVTEGLIVEGNDRETVGGLIESLNGLLMTDSLTSLFNRRFIDDFNLRLKHLEASNIRVNMAMLDLDNMKDVNDTYGHPAGDAVLKDIAGFLKLNFSTRSKMKEQYVVRYGGDEFIILDIGGDPEQFKLEVLDRYSNMRNICYFEDSEIPLTMSCGFSSSDECGWNWNVLLDTADHRMYVDKRSKE